MALNELGQASQKPTVQLGCQTLILIALIVAIFTGGGTGDVKRRVTESNSRLHRIEQKLNETADDLRRTQSEIRNIRNAIERLEQRAGTSASTSTSTSTNGARPSP